MDKLTLKRAAFARAYAAGDVSLALIAGQYPPPHSEIDTYEEEKTMDKFDVKALADECFPVVGLAQMDGVTRAQMASLFRKWKQADQGLSWAEFTRTASGPHSLYSGAILVQWSGMTLCIETDGYTHS